MNAVLIIITVVQLLVALALILIVLFQSGKSQSNFPLSIVCHLLPDYLQRLRRNAENQPTSLCIEKRAC